MLELVRAAIFNQEPEVPESVDVDWDELMTLAHSEGVLAIVWDGLCKLPLTQKPSRLYLINWGLSAQEVKDRYAFQKSVLLDMVSICDSKGLKFLLLKGIGLSLVYPNPSSRESGDIDFYLFGNYKEGNLIFAPTKFSESAKHSSFVYKGVNVENHSVIINQNCKLNRKIEGYLEEMALQAEKRPEGYYVLPPFANIIYLMIHSIHHLCMEYKIPLRNLLDIVVVLRRYENEIHGSEWKGLLERLEMKNHYELIIYLSEWLLGVNMSDFHLFPFEEKEKNCAYETLVTSPEKNIIQKKLSYFVQLRKYLARRKRMNWLLKYEPVPFYDRLYHIIWIQTYIIAKKILRLPEGESFNESFRKKYCFYSR